MSDRFTIEPAPGVHSVRAGGAILVESRKALLLKERGYEPVVYFPRADVGMAFLERSEKTTHCPHKGDTVYFHIVAKSGLIENAGWSYEAPLPGAEEIAGHIAFAHERVTVERI